METALARTPLARAIHPSKKQITDHPFGEPERGISDAVATQCPRNGFWDVGQATGPPLETQGWGPRGLVAWFIPR